jgi:hypothetical protein
MVVESNCARMAVVPFALTDGTLFGGRCVDLNLEQLAPAMRDATITSYVVPRSDTVRRICEAVKQSLKGLYRLADW